MWGFAPKDAQKTPRTGQTSDFHARRWARQVSGDIIPVILQKSFGKTIPGKAIGTRNMVLRICERGRYNRLDDCHTVCHNHPKTGTNAPA